MKRLFWLALLVCAAPAFADSETPSREAFYPPDAPEQVGYSLSDLIRAGEKPLWHGPESGNIVRQTRFVFGDGHPNLTRILHIREHKDGSAMLSIVHVRSGYRKPTRVKRSKPIALDAAQVSAFNSRAEETGTFDFKFGDWDNKDDLFVHCQMLEMERIDASGYRFSSVNIGCVRPAKLMPLIDHLFALAHLKPRAPETPGLY